MDAVARLDALQLHAALEHLSCLLEHLWPRGPLACWRRSWSWWLRRRRLGSGFEASEERAVVAAAVAASDAALRHSEARVVFRSR